MDNLKFNSFAKNIDGQEYCSEVESVAENVIEGNSGNASIIYPSNNKFATMRSLEYRVTDDLAYIILPYPIYKIQRLLINPIGLSDTGGFSYKEYVDENGNYYIPNITKYLVEDNEWNALPEVPENGLSSLTLAKSNTIIYAKGDSSIWISSKQTKRRPTLEQPAYISMLKSAFLGEELKKFVNPKTGYTLYNAVLLNSSINPKNWEFQIEYIPMTSSTKMKAHKAEETTRLYTQIVNQRAEVNSAESFGKYLHATAQKTGTEKLAIAKTYKKIADVPKVGSLVKHNGKQYKIVANSWRVSNPFTFTVVHTLSKNWASKSKRVSVDQKYRNWSIPFNSYIWRTLYYEEFIELSGTDNGINESAFNNYLIEYSLQKLFTLNNEEKDIQIRNLLFGIGYLVTDGAQKGCLLPVSAQGIGSSIVISAQMQDNLSAGLRINPTDTEYCEDVLYCNADGTLLDTRILLTNGIDNFDASAFPYSGFDSVLNKTVNTVLKYDETSTTQYFFDERFYLDKDPGEALKITIQLHYIPKEDWIVVGNKLAEDNPLIAEVKKELYVYGLKNYIRDGVDVIESSELALIGGVVSAGIIMSCEGGKIRIEDEPFMQGLIDNNCKSWCVIDGENNLYIGSNDISKREIYFTWKRTRSKK